ncbi:MAG: hypothetical protein A3K65_06695 [Euryarchaeota archaeon RBG_16_68_12]|nr:MAG: hypothetical protein A3K65_06695 [Euryarchaeota archaeon RBG_16_68_12]
MLEAVQLVLALVILYFLPGWTMVNVIFPRKGEIDREYDLVYRFTLGVVMSIVVTILYGFGLNSLGVDAAGRGYFDATNLWAGLIGLTAIFFAAGWWRGAYPFLGRLHPKLLRSPPPDRHSMSAELERDRVTLAKLRELSAEREKLRRRIKDYERRISLHSGDAKEHYTRERTDAKARLREVDDNLRKLERARAEELYGA